MNVLLIGSGGREHTLGWKIAQSPLLTKLWIAPGNAGTGKIGSNIDILPGDFDAIADFCIKNKVNMVVVGPEAPLVAGLHDYFLKNEDLQHIKIIGPTAGAAMLEGSKDFAKSFMDKYNIPTASYKTFFKSRLNEAKEFIKTLQPPYVLKADGLAAGKGVVILQDLEQALKELEEMLSGSKFGKASNKVVIEEYLDGIELSSFVLTDGKDYLVLPEAKDYKRIGEGDTGLNTGGMGAISPVPFADNEFLAKVEKQIIQPTMYGIKNEGLNYNGFIFFGLMKVKGNPYVVEYNVRMGDPECEAVIPRIKSDLLELFEAVGNKTLKSKNVDIDKRFVSTVVLVSGGYPGSYEKGKIIRGEDNMKEGMAFHAGTKRVGGNTVTNGGRVIALSSFGETLERALEISYKNAEMIGFEKKNFRKDIGKDLMK